MAVMREGSVAAPERHPIDWRNPAFYSETAVLEEMHRVYDICHTCRRCFNLCNAFPTLFDAIDASETAELDSVPKTVYWDVVDQCYLCDMCFLTKCPYVPPHPFNLDFPHLMLRAKAVKYRDGAPKFRDRVLSNTDAMGKLASIPVVVQTVNAALKSPTARKMIDSSFGIHKDRLLPEYTSHTFRKTAAPRADFPVADGPSAPGKVAVYSTCFINYNEPGIGHDLLKVLAHNGIPATLVEKEACCGMPKLELGDLAGVEKLKNHNIPQLAALARAGYAIVTPVPSCTLMYKQELPLLFPDDPEVKAVAEAMFEPFEYFMARAQDGLLNANFTQSLGKVSWHVACHYRVQNFGQKTRELFEKIPGTSVNVVERCSGHDGTWGVKSEFFEASMKIGTPVFKKMASSQPDYICSDCTIAARQIEQGLAASVRKEHPISLLRIAYGLE